MSDWNPSLYLHFAAERSRPAVELLARVSLENIEYIADLGCGPGNPPYGVIITSAGNGDREEFSLEFLLHRSSVTGQFQ